MTKELVAELAFYGVHGAKTDDRGRIWIPKTMLYGKEEHRYQDPLHVGDKIYMRKERKGIYATLLTPQLHDYFYDLPNDNLQREEYFLNGRVVVVRANDSKGNGGRRINLGAVLKELDVILAGHGHFFEILFDEPSLSQRNIDWNLFDFGTHLREDEE